MRAPVAARFGKALLSPALVTAAARELENADVLHLHAPLVPAVPLAFVSTHRQVPIVVTYHCDLRPPPGVVQRFIETVARASQNFALDRAATVVTVYRGLREAHGGARRASRARDLGAPARPGPRARDAVGRRGARALRNQGRPGHPVPRALRGGEGIAALDRRVRRRAEAVSPGRARARGREGRRAGRDRRRAAGAAPRGPRIRNRRDGPRASGEDGGTLRGLRRARPAVDQLDGVLRALPGRGDALRRPVGRVESPRRAAARASDRHGRDRSDRRRARISRASSCASSSRPRPTGASAARSAGRSISKRPSPSTNGSTARRRRSAFARRSKGRPESGKLQRKHAIPHHRRRGLHRLQRRPQALRGGTPGRRFRQFLAARRPPSTGTGSRPRSRTSVS